MILILLYLDIYLANSFNSMELFISVLKGRIREPRNFLSMLIGKTLGQRQNWLRNHKAILTGIFKYHKKYQEWRFNYK